MFDNFSDQYKKTLLQAEIQVKKQGYTNLEEQDVFLEILQIKKGPIYNLFSQFGIDRRLCNEIFLKPEFQIPNRAGVYGGISDTLNSSIVSSVKLAASVGKAKVDIDDFILALVRKKGWFVVFLDYIGISATDFEQNIAQMNKKQSSNNPVEPLNQILDILETGLMEWGELEAFGNIETEKKDPKKSDSDTPALDFFCHDVTADAHNGKIEQIIGRDIEIERLISILNRKTKNNPCLVGDPGVGKTAIVEGLAKRIAEGNVPFAMQNKKILALDMATLLAGTKYRGEFEVRIKQIIDEASKAENEIILFIDEIHTIIGAGGTEGALDAANILKPAMGRGKIRIIGATTLSEYQKYIEKDSALERRFQKIEAAEPSKEVAEEIIKGIASSFEEYHNLIIEENAIIEAVDLSVRYITDRFLPDKAIDLIDEACSLKSMKYNYNQKEITKLKQEIEKIQKDIDSFVVSQQYHKASIAKDKIKALEEEIKKKRAKISIPKEKRYKISSDDVQNIIHKSLGIPMKNLSTEDRKQVLTLDKKLKANIIGQDTAIEAIANSIKRSRAGIANKNRPIGSFLFLGPTGVGKTELVKVLAKEFYGNEKDLIKIDMSEFQERSSASKLIGTTAGYIGYEDGGLLTDQVRRKPYSIVLFDEIEKANIDVFNLLLQILEDGVVTDGKGRKINFKNTIIVMTSNIGSEKFNDNAVQIGFNTTPKEEQRVIKDFEKIEKDVIKELDNYMSPEFINRIDKVVVFRPLEKDTLKKIIKLQIEELKNRLADLNITMTYSPAVVTKILKDTFNPEYGARPVRRYIQTQIEDSLANALIEKPSISTFTIGMKKNEFSFEYK